MDKLQCSRSESLKSKTLGKTGGLTRANGAVVRLVGVEVDMATMVGCKDRRST